MVCFLGCWILGSIYDGSWGLCLWFIQVWYFRTEVFQNSTQQLVHHLTNWTSWSKRDKVWSIANSVFKWCFCNCHRCFCLSSLMILFEDDFPGRVPIGQVSFKSYLPCKKISLLFPYFYTGPFLEPWEVFAHGVLTIRALSICQNWPAGPLLYQSLWKWNRRFPNVFAETPYPSSILFRIWLIWLEGFD